MLGRRGPGILLCGALVAAALGALATPSAATTTPEVTIGDVTVVEPDAGAVTIKFTVDLSVAPTSTVKMMYAVAPAVDGTADPGDAGVKSGSLGFSPTSALSKVITVSVTGDSIVEPAQHFAVTLSALTGPVQFAKSQGILTIEDNDSDGVSSGVEASVGDITIEESDAGVHTAYLPITLSRPPATAVKVSYRVGCSTAAVGADVGASTSGTLGFPIDVQVKLLAIKVTPDTTVEDLESFAQSILPKAGNVSIAQDEGGVTIVDDDGTYNPPPPDPLDVGEVQQVSVESDGTPALYPPDVDGDGGHGSTWPSVSTDGRNVAFVSDACTLVPGDNNGERDIFVRDRVAGTTERVSLNADGTEIGSAQLGPLAGTTNGVIVGVPPQISGNGRYVVFDTPASLVAQDTTAWGSWVSVQDTYLFDRATHRTELVSVLPDGTAAGGAGFVGVRVSADGRYVAFGVDSGSSRFTTSAARTVFVRDRLAGTTTEYPQLGNVGAMSGDGRYLLGFLNGASTPELTLLDRVSGTYERVDVTSAGVPAAYCPFSPFNASNPVSTDGRFVAFVSCAWNLIPGMTGPLTSYSGAYPSELVHAYVRDRLLGTTTLVGGPAPLLRTDPVDVSDDGSTLIQAGSAVTGLVWDVATNAVDTYFAPSEQSVDPMVASDGLSGNGGFVAFTGRTGTRFEVYVQRLG